VTAAPITGVVTTSYPRFAGDYAGTFVAQEVRALAAAGARVEVIAAGPGSPSGPGGEPVRRVDGAGLFYGGGAPETLAAGGASAWAKALAFSSALGWQIARHATRWNQVVSHWLLPCGLAAAVAAPRLPHRAHAHSGDVALLERVLLGRDVARRLADSGADLVFVTEALRNRFAALVGGRIGRVQPMRADPEVFVPPAAGARQAARREHHFSRPVVLTVGRLTRIKGLDVLIEAAAHAARSGPRPCAVTLVMLGEGPERARLAGLAGARDVDLRLPGAVPPPQVASFMWAADLLAHPSRLLPDGRTEGMPVAVLEGLAVGLKVVATATGGLPALARDRRGILLVPPEDPVALSGALCTLLRTDDRVSA